MSDERVLALLEALDDRCVEWAAPFDGDQTVALMAWATEAYWTMYEARDVLQEIAAVEGAVDAIERLRAALRAAGEPCTCDWWSLDMVDHLGTCAIWEHRALLAGEATSERHR